MIVYSWCPDIFFVDNVFIVMVCLWVAYGCAKYVKKLFFGDFKLVWSMNRILEKI